MRQHFFSRELLIAAAIGSFCGVALAGFNGLITGALNGALLQLNYTGITQLANGSPLDEPLKAVANRDRSRLFSGLFVLVMLAIIALNLTSGEITIREHRISQSTEPGEFWLTILFQLNMSCLGLLIFLSSRRAK
jgi:hypothetical protein